MVIAVIHEYGLFFPHYISPGKARHMIFFIATAHFTRLAFVVELCTVDSAEFLFELALWVDASVRTLAIGIPYFPKSLPVCLRVFLPGSSSINRLKLVGFVLCLVEGMYLNLESLLSVLLPTSCK